LTLHSTFDPVTSTVAGKTLKIISWNVNSLNTAQKNNMFQSYVDAEDPDVIALQETKLNATNQPKDLLPGYHEVYSTGEKGGYGGTAIFSKVKPLSVVYELGESECDSEGRMICAEFEKFYLLNTYVPNSGVKLERLKWRTKDTWDPMLLALMKDLNAKKPVVWCGDLNVAHHPVDVRDPEKKKKQPGYQKEERDNFQKVLDAGFVDSYRHLEPTKEQFTFWSYRVNGRANNNGWRLDYFVVSKRLMPSVGASFVRPNVQGSDHCPIGILLAV